MSTSTVRVSQLPAAIMSAVRLPQSRLIHPTARSHRGRCTALPIVVLATNIGAGSDEQLNQQLVPTVNSVHERRLLSGGHLSATDSCNGFFLQRNTCASGLACVWGPGTPTRNVQHYGALVLRWQVLLWSSHLGWLGVPATAGSTGRHSGS